jgi:hypothetical protein
MQEERSSAQKVSVGSPRPELLDTRSAAEYLGLQEHTLETWRCSRRYGLAFIKVGGKVRYRRRVLDDFLDARTIGGEPASAE